MTTNKPEIIGYVPTKDGKLRCGEDGFSLDEYTDQLRDNPDRFQLEPVILFREYEALQAECEKLRKASSELQVECDKISENLEETELRALKFIHQCKAQVELYQELRDERDAIQAKYENLLLDILKLSD